MRVAAAMPTAHGARTAEREPPAPTPRCKRVLAGPRRASGDALSGHRRCHTPITADATELVAFLQEREHARDFATLPPWPRALPAFACNPAWRRWC
jgi:hypothetical protein